MSNNRELDLGNLTFYDFNALTVGEGQEATDAITSQLVENIQFILNSLVEIKKQEIAAVQVLPEEQQLHDFEKSNLHLVLPEPKTIFPRSRKIPEAKKQSKWDKYAKEKGIKKRKQNGLAYDPTLGKQVARWGRKSKKNVIKEFPIMQEKQEGRNPFQDADKEKKLRVYKQKLKESKNRSRNAANK